MRLTIKVILIIAVTVTTIISGIFYIMAQHFEEQMQLQLLSTARSMYNNILIVRKWVSDKEGVFVKKKTGSESNPYLKHPELLTANGDTLVLRNPALVTRELSNLTALLGKNFSFHMASLRFLNPENTPDDFERSALLFFRDSLKENNASEFYRSEMIDGKQQFRYFAPLYTEESCLSCHAEHGYSLGDVRGGISIMISKEQFQEAKEKNKLLLLIAAIFTICILSALIYLALRYIVIKPLKLIENSTEKIREGHYDFSLYLKQKDEIGSLAFAFEEMRKKIKQTTEKLISDEAKYRSMINHSVEAVAIINDKGEIIEFNSKLINLTGFNEKDIKNVNLFDIINLDSTKAIKDEKKDGIIEAHFESTLSSTYGLKIPVEIYKIKGFTQKQNANLSLVYIRDLSERKKIEQYSIQTEKIFALGQISSGIAHEIRNPLFAITNNLDFLKQNYKDSEKFNEVYPEFKDGINRIEQIVSAILDYAKPHELSFEFVQIKAIIEKSLILVQKQFEKSAIKINTDYNHNSKPIEVDSHQIEQVFINLLLNAFQAMSGAGVLNIRTNSTSSYLIIEIEDTGKGIPKDEIDRVFDPFYSKSPNGTGLGMAIVQRILNQHNAPFNLDSKVGLGTTFTISFPYSRG